MIYLFAPVLLIFSFLYGATAQAVCPVCTVAVTACVGLSRWLGVDDTISGLWVGGLTVSLIMWTINWLNSKNIKFYGRKIGVTVAYYILIFVPLYYTNFIGHPLNKMWGLDKLVLGSLIGSILFFAGVMLYEYLKAKNNGHAYFPYQKVAMPIFPLVIMSLIFYFFICK